MKSGILKTVIDFDFKVEMMRNHGSIKWEYFFDSEEDIISALSEIPIVDEKCIFYGSMVVYKGYKYIHSFAKIIQSGQKLSDSQMKQAKRLASEIKKAHLIRNMW